MTASPPKEKSRLRNRRAVKSRSDSSSVHRNVHTRLGRLMIFLWKIDINKIVGDVGFYGSKPQNWQLKKIVKNIY